MSNSDPNPNSNSDSYTDTNRLGDEKSPYLQQHADNPVNWQPWDDEALEEARERDVPIFVSIGYSSCHWCHVMEEESFEDDEVAEALNENFVPIKVDREERPDIDRIYQTTCQIVAGGGGWPLSVWLTPDQRPFYIGTYFPKNPKRGQNGFLNLLGKLADDWENDRQKIEERADKWTRAVKGELELSESEETESGEADFDGVLEDGVQQAVRSADRKYGGFGDSGPKFPTPPRYRLLVSAYDQTGRSALKVAVESLDAMANGGLYDHVGGGFHRYVTDREWVVPHFEKMLYDNAEIPRLFLDAYRVTGKERYADVVEETFDFVEREMTSPEGGFYSTLDARSEGEEGKFYTWTADEVDDVLSEDEAKLFRERYGVTESGNFEGSNVLTVSNSFDEIADEVGMGVEEVERLLEDAKAKVFEAREERVRPDRDDKILAGWNGLMVSALANSTCLDGSEDYIRIADDALGFVRENLWDSETLYRRYKDGDVAVEGYLEDYAFVARGALDLYEATGDLDHLVFSLELARRIRNEFWDADDSTVYFTSETGESLVARPQEINDSSTPSSLGVTVDLLLSLSGFDPDFEEIAEAVLTTHAETVKSNPLGYPSLALAADHYTRGSSEITLAGDEETVADWIDEIGDIYIPHLLVTRRPNDAEYAADRLGLEDVPPVWKGRGTEDGDARLYACRGFTCSRPLSEVDEAVDWLEDKRNS
ncbi:thioredoxin domain-containing protein [Halorutilales archaeon Cl-col2-1]